ncbi:MAG TPA: nuclear transport factor 2 family protein [Mycobacteriales bacterium]|nr:nuclear transport factor 2 family protein [Mycobacteriales bacterium]
MTGGDTTAAIAAVVEDYFGAWFTGDVERMRRALHPDLAKRGVVDGLLGFNTAQSMVEATEAGAGTRHDPSKRAIDIHVTHVHGSIATAIVTGPIYVEYVHLARLDDRWQIVNTLWARAADT